MIMLGRCAKMAISVALCPPMMDGDTTVIEYRGGGG